MASPLIVFAVLLWVGREDLGIKGISLCLLISIALVFGCGLLNLSPYISIALLALLDIVLILILLRGDIRIR